MKREDFIAALRPLVDRMPTSHCWIKGRNGPRHIDEPLDPVKLSEHVMGGSAYGLCPIAPGESTCRVAALDFDSHKGETPWADMALVADGVAFALEQAGYRPAQFRSSGGHGIHLYLIWDEPQDAYSVRELLRGVLADNGLTAGTGGIAKGQVEIFPKQDEVPSDGFGNMFILPYSGKSEPIAGELVASPDVPVRERPVPVAPAIGETPPELERLKSALDAIPNSGEKELSYDDWRNHIFAIHHATGGDASGLALAHEFSSRSSKYDPDFLDTRVWPYVRSDRDGAVVTARTLFASASGHGWIDPDIVNDFQVVEEVTADVPEGAGDEGLRFEFVPESEFTVGQSKPDIVAGVIPDADLIVAYGESGSGKTFFVLDLVQSIARGLAWRDKAVQQGRVAYVVAEGASGFRNRLRAYKHANELQSTDLVVLADAPNFMLVPHVKAVIMAIKRAGPIKLVVVDTLAQVTPGANENAGEDIGKVIHHCRQIRKKTGAAVLLIHHSGKDASRGARGWSGLRAAADAEIEIVRAEHDRVATITKMKDGDEGQEFGFRLKQIPIGMDEAGEITTSCVVEYTAATAKDRKAREPKGDKQRLVWQAVLDLVGLGAGNPGVEDVITEAVKQVPFDPADGKRDTRRQHCLRALEALRDAGRVLLADGKVGLPGEQ